MRKIISLGIAGMLTVAAVATWAAAHKEASTKVPTESIGAMDPLGLMKKAKDLPVHNITDAF